jgi:hypothetical protein
MTIMNLEGANRMENISIATYGDQIENWFDSFRAQAHQSARIIAKPISYWRSSTFAIVLYLAIVAGVSIYDFILTIEYSHSLEYMEQNPVGRWLMGLDKLKFGQLPNIGLFLASKAIGTMVVLVTMYYLYTTKIRIGHPVALGVTVFQLLLLCYLTYDFPNK